MSKGLKRGLVVIAIIVAALFVLSNLNANVSQWLNDGKDILIDLFVPGSGTGTGG